MEIFFFYFSDDSQEKKPCSNLKVCLKDSQNCKLRSIHIKNDNYCVHIKRTTLHVEISSETEDLD